MERRQDPSDESWRHASAKRLASLNGTGKHSPIPQRPAGMARVDQTPSTPKIERPYAPKVERPESSKVERPWRQAVTQQGWQRRIFLLSSICIICALLACGIGYVAFNYINGLGVSSGPALVADDFLRSLSQKNYNQAYQDLDVKITLPLSPEEFVQQAKNADRCYGQITNYSEISGSAVNQENSQSYSYMLSRSRLSKPYQIRLTLQQDQDASNNWKITSYGGNLGPDLAIC